MRFHIDRKDSLDAEMFSSSVGKWRTEQGSRAPTKIHTEDTFFQGGHLAEHQQGFILTRHWRDTADGTEVEFWLATDDGPRHLRLRPQDSVAFIPAEQRERAETVLQREKQVELRPLDLVDFSHRPVLGLYSKHYRQLTGLERRLKQAGVDVYEADVFPGPLHDGAFYYGAGRVQRRVS